MDLTPELDSKIDRYNLDSETAEIANLIYRYDLKWNNSVRLLESLNAKVENLSDELKILRMDLFCKAKTSDGKVSDKMAEAISISSQEYIEQFNRLKELRMERANAQANERLYCSFHYILLEKAKSINILYQMHTAQYFNTDRNSQPKQGGADVKKENVTNELNLKLKRRTLKK
jgi:hypothetical protein